MKFEDYIQIEEMGKGAYAIVSKRRHRTNGDELAFKVLTKKSLSQLRDIERFRREIRIMTSLKGHPHIVEILHSYVSEGRSYLVMPLAEYNLHEFFQEHNQKAEFDFHYRVELFDQILAAMVHAHKLNVLHRDLSPPNVLVFEENYAQIFKLADFGLGKRLDSESLLTTSKDHHIGRMSYTAPEVLESLDNASMASDVYSLGKMLQFVLTGKIPNHSPKCDFKGLILKSTSEEPSRRQQSAQEFFDDFENAKKLRGLSEGPPLSLKAMLELENIDWRSFHTAVMRRKFNKSYEDYIAPINTIILKDNRVEEYVDFIKLELIDFVSAYRFGLGELKVFWPFSAVETFCELLERIYDATNDNQIKTECLAQIWDYAYPSDQTVARKIIDRMIPVIPKDIWHDFADEMLKSLGKSMNYAHLDDLTTAPEPIRRAIDMLIEKEP